jgi:hypothetical protein
MPITDHATRAQYQAHIDQLLSELDERRRHLYRLQVAGVQPARLADIERDLDSIRERLQQATSDVP